MISYDDHVAGPFYNPEATYVQVDNSDFYTDNSINSTFQDRLDKLGEEGWEMVSFTGNAQDISSVMVFKRIKK